MGEGWSGLFFLREVWAENMCGITEGVAVVPVNGNDLHGSAMICETLSKSD